MHILIDSELSIFLSLFLLPLAVENADHNLKLVEFPGTQFSAPQIKSKLTHCTKLTFNQDHT